MSDNNQLAVLKEQIEGLVVGGATIEQIESYLGNLWDAAPENSEERAIIHTAWTQIQATGHAVTLAETAVAVAKEMTEQRDLIADELANLARSIQIVKEHGVVYDEERRTKVNKLILELMDAVAEDALQQNYDGIWSSAHFAQGCVLGWTMQEAENLHTALNYDPYEESCNPDDPMDEVDDIAMDEAGFTYTGLLEFRRKLRVMVAELFDSTDWLKGQLAWEQRRREATLLQQQQKVTVE